MRIWLLFDIINLILEAHTSFVELHRNALLPFVIQIHGLNTCEVLAPIGVLLPVFELRIRLKDLDSALRSALFKQVTVRGYRLSSFSRRDSIYNNYYLNSLHFFSYLTADKIA